MKPEATLVIVSSQDIGAVKARKQTGVREVEEPKEGRLGLDYNRDSILRKVCLKVSGGVFVGLFKKSPANGEDLNCHCK